MKPRALEIGRAPAAWPPGTAPASFARSCADWPRYDSGMCKTTGFALLYLVAGCAAGSTPGAEEYDRGMQEMRAGLDQAWDGVSALQTDLGSAEGRDEIRSGLDAMHSGASMMEEGLEMMGSDWARYHGCHGHPPDLAEPVSDDLANLYEAHQGMMDDDQADDGEHLGHVEDGLHELEHHLDGMELEMECMRHHR